MSVVLLVFVGVVLGGLLGAVVPELIARIPEPVDPPADVEPDAGPETGPETAAETDDEEAKELYVAMARLTWLRPASVALGATMGGLFASGAPDLSLTWLWPLVPVLVALSIIDARTRLLPKIVVIPATLVTIVVVAGVGLASGAGDQVVRALIAMVVLRSVYWVLWFLHSAGLGFGDVRYAALLGLVLGWVGWGAVAVATMVSLLTFVLGPLVMLAVTRDRAILKKAIAFGPFMTLGLVVGVTWGPELAAYIWG